jgi:hypothetical protein
MAKVSLELDTTDVIRILNDTRGNVPRAAATGINRATKQVRTVMVRAVREDVGLKAKAVRDAMIFKPAVPSPDPAARLAVSKRRLSLIHWSTRQTPNRGARRTPVRTRLKGGTQTIPGAFIERGRHTKSGGLRSGTPATQIFRRVHHPGRSPRRSSAHGGELPLRALKGPSLARPFARHWRKGVKKFREVIPGHISRALRFARRR